MAGSVQYKAIELDVRSGRPTGEVRHLVASSRREAIETLLRELGVSADRVAIGPNERLVQVDGRAWSIVAPATVEDRATRDAHLRRGGPKHRRT